VKKLLIGLAVFLSLAVITVLVGPGFVDWNRYKAPIESRLGALFGQPVTIGGPVDFALLPTPILSASGVRVAGPTMSGTDEAAAAPMLEIGGLDARVALAPLLTGTLQVERVILIDPVVRVVRGTDGETNWRALVDDSGSPPADVRLDRVTVENGTLIWRDASLGREQRIAEIFAQLSADSLRGPVTALGSFAVGDQALTFDLAGGRLSGSGAWPVNLTLGVDGADAEFRFAGILARSGRVQGDVRGSGSDLGAVLVRLLPLDGVPDAARDTFSFQTAVDGRADTVALNGVVARLGESRATGAASLVPGAPWQADVALSVDRLDLDAWLGDGGSLRRLATAPVVLPRGVAARIDATIEAAAWRGGLVRRISLDGALDDGRLTINGLRAELPGSARLAVAGRLGAAANDGEPGGPEPGVDRPAPPTPWLDLRGEAEAGDLRGLLAWLDLDGADIPPARLHALAGRARLTAGPRAIRLTALDVAVDSTSVTGTMSLGQGERPSLGARLSVDRLDLDSYLPENAPDTPRAAADWLGSRFGDWSDLAAARTIAVDLRAGSLTVAGIDFADPVAVAEVADGAVGLSELSWRQALGTRARLSGRIGSLRPVGSLDLSLVADAETLAPLTAALGPVLPVPADSLGTVSLNGRLRGDPGALSVDGHARLAGGEVMVSGSLDDRGAARAVDLTARIAADEAHRMIALLVPDRAPPAGFGPVDLYARVRGDADAVAVEDLQGRLGPVDLTGEAAWRASEPRDRLTVSLRTGDLPLDAFAAVAMPGVPGPPVGGGWRLPPTLDGLEAVDGRFALNATSLSAGVLTVADTALRAELDAGVLDIERMDGRLFGGRLGVTGTLDATADPPRIAGRMDLGGADLAEALAVVFGADGLDGVLDFRFEGEAAGQNRSALLAGLTGEGLAAARGGRIAGVDLAALDRGLRTLDRPSDFLAVLDDALGGGQTPFDALNVPFEVTDGVAATDRLRLSTPAATGDGRGRLDLARDRLDLTTELHPASLPTSAPPLGIRLTGLPSMPRRRLETQALQAYVAQRAADALSERYRGGDPSEPDGASEDGATDEEDETGGSDGLPSREDRPAGEPRGEAPSLGAPSLGAPSPGAPSGPQRVAPGASVPAPPSPAPPAPAGGQG